MTHPHQHSTLKAQEMKSFLAWIKSQPRNERARFLNSLSENAILSLPWLFEVWALPHQLPPKTPWRQWVLMGGRGAGKTRAGAEWVRSLVEGARPADKGRCRHIALIAETIDQAREVMVMGDSGIMASSPPDRRPKFLASRNKLLWPNGAEATLYSAFAPEALRGPQFDGAWLDEFAKWPKAEETWTQLQFALRLGQDPRALITTTPRVQKMLKTILEMPNTVTTSAPSDANAHNLAPGFLSAIKAQFGQTHIGRQEIEGILLEDQENTLFPYKNLIRAENHDTIAHSRIIISVDPSVSDQKKHDACGIIVAAVDQTASNPFEWHAEIIEDATAINASPKKWAVKVVELYHKYQADSVICETNQGGALIKTLFQSLDANIPVNSYFARLAKHVRAEPVALLYEQNRIKHKHRFDDLYEELSEMTTKGVMSKKSPDRADALIWALHALLLDNKSNMHPKIRQL